MARETGSSLLGTAAEAAMGAIEYPFVHPIKTAKFLAIGGLSIAAAAVTMQTTHMIAEHGGIWPQGSTNEQ
jgi:hypothetical protein